MQWIALCSVLIWAFALWRCLLLGRRSGGAHFRGTAVLVAGVGAVQVLPLIGLVAFEPIALWSGVSLGGLALAVVEWMGRRSRPDRESAPASLSSGDGSPDGGDQADLSASLSLLKSTLESTADGLLVVDKAGRIVRYNDKFVAMWGIPQDVLKRREDEQAIAHVLRQLRDPNDFLARIQALYEDASAESFDTLYFKDGRIFERYSRPQTIGDQVVGRVWSFRDVTKRKLAKKEAEDLKLFYERVMDELPIELAVLDTEFRYRYVNRGSLSDAERRVWIIGKTDMDYCQEYGVDPEVAGRRQAWYREVVATKKASSFEETLHSRTGEIRHIRRLLRPVLDDDGQIVYFVGYGLDITESREAKKALLESEERYRQLLNLAPVSIAVIDTTGDFLYVNEATVRMLGGETFDDILGRSMYEFVEKGEREDAAERMDLIRKEIPTGLVERRLVRFDGEERCVQVLAHPITFKGKRAAQSVSVDITEQKRAEAERERFVQELERKNAELERFTYTVSHDLKSPLVTIKGFLRLLREDIAENDIQKVEQDLGHIERASDQMFRLLDELLDLSSIGRILNPPLDVSLEDLIRDALSLVTLPEGLIPQVQSNLPMIRGDRIRILEVIQNLIENAVKFMDDTPDPSLSISAQHEQNEVILCVRDNGIGIDPRYHEKIFGLFERLNSQTEGSGVGLALVKRIVEVHGGRVWVESEGRGTGSAFFVTFQAA